MFRSFWFYFNAIPVAFSILFFSINLLFVWDRLKLVGPSISEAVGHCKDVSNDTWADDERTHQDVCIDKFMGEESFMTETFELFWVLGLLISLAGIIFIIPLSIYLLLSWRMHRYGHY